MQYFGTTLCENDARWEDCFRTLIVSWEYDKQKQEKIENEPTL